MTDVVLFHFELFCLFTPLTTQKMGKTPGDIIILHVCTKIFDHMMHSS